MSQGIDRHRRSFLGTTFAGAVAACVGLFGCAAQQSAYAQPPGTTPSRPTASASLGPLKQIDAGVLNVGYAELGPPSGPAVLLLHGWPYDISSFAEVAPLLASAGYHVVVPYTRGYGTTRFLSSTTPPWPTASRSTTIWRSG
jgi:hypothetical protein